MEGEGKGGRGKEFACHTEVPPIAHHMPQFDRPMIEWTADRWGTSSSSRAAVKGYL